MWDGSVLTGQRDLPPALPSHRSLRLGTSCLQWAEFLFTCRGSPLLSPLWSSNTGGEALTEVTVYTQTETQRCTHTRACTRTPHIWIILGPQGTRLFSIYRDREKISSEQYSPYPAGSEMLEGIRKCLAIEELTSENFHPLSSVRETHQPI